MKPEINHNRISLDVSEKPRLSFIHLQLTAKCNLRCQFCGQWGKNGYFHKSGIGQELSASQWQEVINEAVNLSGLTGQKPEFIIWGGEPLCSTSFKPVVKRIYELGCKIAVVTNGTFIEKYIDTINRYVSTLYISLDGQEFIHEKIRNVSGIYPGIISGLSQIDNDKVKTICMTTVCKENLATITNFPYMIAKYGFEEMIIQNLIYCTTKQASFYRKWLQMDYNQTATNIDSWIIDQFEEWTEDASEELQKCLDKIEREEYPIPVTVYPIGNLDNNINDWFDPQIHLQDTPAYCKMPFRHLSILANGSVNFCVDFTDFSLGNVNTSLLVQMWNSKLADRFRKDVKEGHNPVCQRCPWLYNQDLIID